MTTQLSPTPRSTVHRGGHRARTDRAELYALLDSALVCHLSFVRDGAPVVLPTGFGRDGDTLYLHGSSGARSLRETPGSEVCVAVTLLDGVVYSRAVFHCSMNYRSAVIHGRARVLSGDHERLDALRAVTEHLAPGSWGYARSPSGKELAATTVLAVDLAEAAVKVRDGGPGDEPEDILHGEAWAGVVPVVRQWGEPVPANDLDGTVPVPEHVARRAGR